MTNTEYGLLCSVRDGKITDFSALSPLEQSVLADLSCRGLVTVFRSRKTVINPSGVIELAAHEEQLDRLRNEAEDKASQNAKKDRAERKANSRSWWQFFLGLVFGWLLGSFTAGDVLRWLIDLLR